MTVYIIDTIYLLDNKVNNVICTYKLQKIIG